MEKELRELTKEVRRLREAVERTAEPQTRYVPYPYQTWSRTVTAWPTWVTPGDSDYTVTFEPSSTTAHTQA